MADNKWIQLEDVLRRRQLITQSNESLIWGAINALSALIFLIELKLSLIGNFLTPDLTKTLLTILVSVIICILILNVIYDLGLYCWQKYLMIPIELTSTQMKAFGIKPNEMGFKECNPTIGDNSKPFVETMPPTPPFELSLISDLNKHSSLNSTALSSPNSSVLTDGLSPQNSSLNSTSTSWVFQRINGSNSLSQTSPDRQVSSVRSRKTNKPEIHNHYDVVYNEMDLNKYLTQFEEREERYEEVLQAEKRHERNSCSNAWNYIPSQTCPPIDESNKTCYQFAIDSPSRLNDVEFDSMNSCSSSPSKAMDAILSKLKTDETKMNEWIENIRKWISLTILCRLVQEIDQINEMLIKMGSIDSLIGESGLPSIKQISTLKKSQIHSLESVIPFLELCPNQQYLVKRIRDLAKGGCIGKFKWNCGGNYNLKPWSQELPTDSDIVMHLFCTYMDLRLPSNPNSPEGKAFTNLYFKSISGPTPKSWIYINKVKANPPHYKVWTDNEVWELPLGRNNLFHAILVFLDLVKSKHFGLLGPVNLGQSGINILWVVD